jgi:hypothetical protein
MVAASKPATATATTIQFVVQNSNRGLWNTLRKNEYDDCLQPLLELIDNAFASGCTKIVITLDFEKNTGSIEDNGRGFGDSAEELSRCFTYGPDVPRQTDLNEHGCGMKSSLAILDPTDSSWCVTWKVCPAAGPHAIHQVKAPYATDGNFEATRHTSWPGKLTDPTGSIIQFPFHKENLGALYEKRTKASFAQVIPKLRQELSHRWMFFDAFASGKIEMYLKEEKACPKAVEGLGDRVVPFVMPAANTEYVSKCIVNNTTLANGAKIHMEQYSIAENLPGSPWFKKSTSCNGAYIFKNGRAIVKITAGSEYAKIFGVVPDNHHNGMIVLVNITGPTESLPVTVPTKNKFKATNNPNYEMAVQYIQGKVVLPQIDKPSEEALLSKFLTTQSKAIRSCGMKYESMLEHRFPFENPKFNSPSLDAVEIVHEKMYAYEAKKDNAVSLQTVLQMYGNFLLATAAIQSHAASSTAVPIPRILIHAETTYRLPDTLQHTIQELAHKSTIGFPLEIWNYSAEKLFPLDD